VSLDSAALFALAMILMLFVVAAWVESRGAQLRKFPRQRHLAYTLALGVYCSSWTFYGAVGSAARDGWSYLPIYLGPILLLLAAPRFPEAAVPRGRGRSRRQRFRTSSPPALAMMRLSRDLSPSSHSWAQCPISRCNSGRLGAL
jgi:hypothetical protein